MLTANRIIPYLDGVKQVKSGSATLEFATLHGFQRNGALGGVL